MVLQKSANAIELNGDAEENFVSVAQVVLGPELLELAEQGNDRNHSTGRAGSRATMGKPVHTFGIAGFDRQPELLELLRRLCEIQIDQLPETIIHVTRELGQARHVDRVHCRLSVEG